jgi:ATP-dependent Clp protease adapter protein ClpS
MVRAEKNHLIGMHHIRKQMVCIPLFDSQFGRKAQPKAADIEASVHSDGDGACGIENY